MHFKIRFIFVFLLILGNMSVLAQNKIDSIFEKKFQYSMISRGNNYPDFSSKKDSMDYLLFSLHKNIPIEYFMEKTNFDKHKMDTIISFLEAKDWIHKVGNTYKPSIFIASNADGDSLFKYATPISRDITSKIINSLGEIKSQFETTDIAKTDSFDVWSFFILSNVLLDNWQINNVERDFLKRSNRPERHGKFYFQEIAEWNEQDRESFGIYGNQRMRTKDEKVFCIYGNNRGIEVSNNLYDKKISVSDNVVLEKIATSFRPNLLIILESNRAYSEQIYEKLGYSKENSYDEFFIWWYHFIYTQSTNELSEKGVLNIPDTGNFYYELEFE